MLLSQATKHEPNQFTAGMIVVQRLHSGSRSALGATCNSLSRLISNAQSVLEHGCRTKIRLRRSIMSGTEVYSPGLEGIIAGETAISTVEGGLRYRGYPVTELAEKATFDEVAYLLLHGDLPTAAQLAAFQKRVAAVRVLPASVLDLFTALP